jgi:agmatine/peptidylarginine deiminase
VNVRATRSEARTFYRKEVEWRGPGLVHDEETQEAIDMLTTILNAQKLVFPTKAQTEQPAVEPPAEQPAIEPPE